MKTDTMYPTREERGAEAHAASDGASRRYARRIDCEGPGAAAPRADSCLARGGVRIDRAELERVTRGPAR
jgi:hypothetical protein